MQYYKFIGKAYNSKVLNRVTIEDQAPGSSQFTYVVDGQPQTMEHTTENDKKYGYSKQVFNAVPGDKSKTKLFSTSCNKLKYNNTPERLEECQLASGYFLVHEQSLFQEPFSDKIENFSIQF